MKTKAWTILLIVALSFWSCQDDFAYKYADKEAVIECDQINQKMLNEAMYSFQEDVAEHFNFRSYSPSTPVYYQWGFASYAYNGSQGTAPYEEIVRDQSKLILLELVKQKGLFNKDNGQFALNYKHPLVTCLIDKISDDPLRSTIQTLVDVDQMNARLLAEPLRKNIKRLAEDKHLILFMGLATYYPQLMNRNMHLNQNGE